MELRTGREQDREQVQQMWTYCFNEQDDFLSWYFDTYWQPQDALVLESGEPYQSYIAENGETQSWIGASLQMVPYSMLLRGTEQETSYIVGVAVAPELRGGGVSRELMRCALAVQRQKGQLVSLLLPFDYGFYRKLGYEVCYGLKYIECGVADLRPLCRNYGRVVRVCREHSEQLNTVYQEAMQGRNGYVLRTRRDWDFIFDTFDFAGGFVFAVQNDYGEMEGYVTFLKNRERIRVKELCYSSADALGALLRFLASHYSSYEAIYFDLPQDSPLGLFLHDPREAAAIERPYVMARVIDVGKALASLKTDCPLAVQVKDDLLTENDGVFRVSNGVLCQEPPAAQMDITVFSQLYMGFLSVREEWEAGRLTVRDRDVLAQLDAVFPKQRNFINHILADE